MMDWLMDSFVGQTWPLWLIFIACIVFFAVAVEKGWLVDLPESEDIE